MDGLPRMNMTELRNSYEVYSAPRRLIDRYLYSMTLPMMLRSMPPSRTPPSTRTDAGSGAAGS